MIELFIYGMVFLAVLAHVALAVRMYLAVHNNKKLTIKDKNEWKLKALILPEYYWPLYKKTT
jgi:hypothetical protein